MIDYESITERIGSQLEAYCPGRFLVTDEQRFSSAEAILPTKVYIVLRFGQALMNYAQTTVPVTALVMGLPNEAESTKALLFGFTQAYNLSAETNDGITLVQTYSSPSVLNNFNDVADAFRQLMYFTCQFSYMEGSDYIESAEYIDAEGSASAIKYLAISPSLNLANNTQPLPSGRGLATTVGKYGTFTLGISCYLDSSAFVQACERIMFLASEESSDSASLINREFRIRLHFAVSGEKTFPLRLLSMTPSQAIAGVPTVQLSFVR